MQESDKQYLFQPLFQTFQLPKLKQIQCIKPEIQCFFTMEVSVDVNELCKLNASLKKDQKITLQIRKKWVVQTLKKEVLKGIKKVFVDQIVSGWLINEKYQFQMKRQYQIENQPLSKPFGMILEHKQNKKTYDFFSEQPGEKLQKFGQILESRFCIQKNFHGIFKPIRKIGKGASATVVEGLDLRTNSHYAVKGFKKSKGYSFEKVISFAKQGILYKEISILKQMQFPNVVKLNAVFETQNSLYMVLEKYEQNLYEFLINKGLSLEYQLKAIIKGLLQILQYLHSKNIMHRDIKPENIMIKRLELDKKEMTKRKTNIQPVLIDFGFAEYELNQEFHLYRCGTPGFIAPQILNDYLVGQEAKDSFNSQESKSKRKYSKACDIFSLGCLFHILLTGRMLFQGKTKRELIRNNMEANMSTQHRDYKLMDVLAKKLLFKMLEKDPQKRITAKVALGDQFFRMQMFNFKQLRFKISLLNQIQDQPKKESEQQDDDKYLMLFQ